MAPPPPPQDVSNAYELLGISIECTEAEIRTAYRQRSLKVHPDRHPNNPEASTKFHELNQAYELLLDPIRKTALDASLRVKAARKERFAKHDAKRKGMQDELEEAERVVKRAKGMAKEERERKEEAERIKEEGRRMRMQKQVEITRKQEEHEKLKESDRGGPLQLGPLDTTVRIKYPLSQHPTLITSSAISVLLSIFGPIDEASIVLSMKSSKKAPQKPPKFATALIPFKTIGDAFAAVCSSGSEVRGLKDINISWAGEEPAVLEKLKRDGSVNVNKDVEPHTPLSSHKPPFAPRTSTGHEKVTTGERAPPPSFSFDPSDSSQSADISGVPGLDYESLTLLRLRQAERERLEREIREQETAE